MHTAFYQYRLVARQEPEANALLLHQHSPHQILFHQRVLIITSNLGSCSLLHIKIV